MQLHLRWDSTHRLLSEVWGMVPHKVFCPRCCTEAHERDNMEVYRLFECGCKECGGNPSVSRDFYLHQKIETTCCHLSRRVLGHYVS